MIARALAAAVLSATACIAVADDLGRMFFTPEQRASLDKSRKQTTRTETDGEFKPPAPPVPHNVAVTGMIRRSDGRNTIWLNGRVLNERQTGDINARVVGHDNHVRLKGPDGGRSVDVKVGQTVEILSGTIEDSYSRRTTAKPVATAAAGNENRAPDVPKVMPSPLQEPVKSEALAQKRPARALDRDDAEDVRPIRRMETK